MKRDKGVFVRMGTVYGVNIINIFMIKGLLQHYGVQEEVPLISAFLNIQFFVIGLASIFYEMHRSGSFEKNTKKCSFSNISFSIGLLIALFYFIYLIAKDWSLWIEFF